MTRFLPTDQFESLGISLVEQLHFSILFSPIKSLIFLPMSSRVELKRWSLIVYEFVGYLLFDLLLRRNYCKHLLQIFWYPL